MDYNFYQLSTGGRDEREVLLQEAEKIQRYSSIHWLPSGLKFLKECRGSFYLSCIVLMWAYNSYLIPVVVLLPMYQEQQVGAWTICLFLGLSATTIVCLSRSTLSDPGYVSLHNRATTPNEINWTHCKKCLIQRPLKSHHCSRCRRCVRRMDHHCPWINNCVGEDNQWIFVLLLFYGSLLSGCALLLDVLHFYYFKPCTVCDKESFLFKHQRDLMYGCFVTGIILGVFCCTQLITQTYNISLDKTTVESLIYGHKPINEQPPVTKTPMDSFHDVFGQGPILLWLNPFRRRRGRNIIVYAEVA